MLEIDKIIDFNLDLLHKSKNGSLFWQQFDNSINKDLSKKDIAEHMERKELIFLEPTKRQVCNLTRKGISISSNGGWIEHVKKSEEKENREEDKFKHDYFLSKWKRKTFWWVFIMGLTSFLYSAFDFITTHVISKDKQQKEVIQTEKK